MANMLLYACCRNLWCFVSFCLLSTDNFGQFLSNNRVSSSGYRKL